MVIDSNEINACIESLCANVHEQYTIDPRHDQGSAVKRGLRNSDGTGVIAGVTQIGSVQGYYLRDRKSVV